MYPQTVLLVIKKKETLFKEGFYISLPLNQIFKPLTQLPRTTSPEMQLC